MIQSLMPVVVGVISANMCRRYASSKREPTASITSLEARLLLPKGAYATSFSQAVLSVQHGKAEIAMHAGRGDIRHHFTGLSQKGFMHNHNLGDITLSILPAVTIKQPSDIVSWSTYSAGDTHMCGMAATQAMGPTDFLLQHCVQSLGYEGRINYTLHIFERPLLFGEAVLQDTGHRFHFASVLSCKEMCEMGAL